MRPPLLRISHDEPPRAAGRFVPGHSYSGATQIKPGERLSPATQFKAGQPARNKLPVGSVTIRIDQNGTRRAWIKVAEPGKWVLRARYVWESVNGPVPRGMLVHHDDRDSLNDSPSNLIALTRSQHIVEHSGEFGAKRVGCKDSAETRQRKREAQLRRYARERRMAP